MNENRMGSYDSFERRFEKVDTNNGPKKHQYIKVAGKLDGKKGKLEK